MVMRRGRLSIYNELKQKLGNCNTTNQEVIKKATTGLKVMFTEQEQEFKRELLELQELRADLLYMAALSDIEERIRWLEEYFKCEQ